MPIEPKSGGHGTGPTFPPPDPNAPQPANAPVWPLNHAQTLQAEIKAAHEGYGIRVAVAFDKFFAALADAPPDVTLSEQAGVMAYKDKGIKGWYGRMMSTWLGWIQKNHGAKATCGGNAEAEEAIKYGDDSGLLNK